MPASPELEVQGSQRFTRKAAQDTPFLITRTAGKFLDIFFCQGDVDLGVGSWTELDIWEASDYGQQNEGISTRTRFQLSFSVHPLLDPKEVIV